MDALVNSWRLILRLIVPTLAIVLAIFAGSRAQAADITDRALLHAMESKFNDGIIDSEWKGYYQHSETNVPQWTPDGGAYWMFWGQLGRGAIYAAPTTGAWQPHLVYGPVLDAWASQGYERTHGYPVSEQFVSPPGASCTAWQLGQRFVERDGQRWIYCWDAEQRVVRITAQPWDGRLIVVPI